MVEPEQGHVRIQSGDKAGWTTRLWVNGRPLDGVVTRIEYRFDAKHDNEVILYLSPTALEIDVQALLKIMRPAKEPDGRESAAEEAT